MRIAAGFITVPGRQYVLSETLASLRESCSPIGYRILSDEARTGCWQAWLRLLRSMVADPRGASHLLLCEDDVIFTRGLYDYLLRNPPPADSVANLFCTSECHRPELMQWHRQPLPARAQGSLALLIPLAIARKLAAAPPNPDDRDGTDRNVGLFCREHDIPFVTHSPSLVLHATLETSLTVERGRAELRQAFCFAESINECREIAYGMYRAPTRWPIDEVGDFPAGYSARKLSDDHSSRRRLPDHPHTLAVYQQAGV